MRFRFLGFDLHSMTPPKGLAVVVDIVPKPPPEEKLLNVFVDRQTEYHSSYLRSPLEME